MKAKRIRVSKTGTRRIYLFLVCLSLSFLMSCTYNRTIVLQQRPISTPTDTLGGQSLDYKESVILSNPIKK